MVLTFFIFPPAFLFSLFTHPDIAKKTKIIVTIAFVALICLAGAFGEKQPSDNTPKPAKTEVASEAKTEKSETAKPAEEKSDKVKPNEETKEDKFYFVRSEQALKEYFEKQALAAGQGIPDVDARFSTYREWNMTDGIKVSEGTFYLAGNENIEHKYVIRWRIKNDQLLRMAINDKKVYYNEEASYDALDDDKK